MARMWLCAVFLVVSWNLDTLTAITTDKTDATNCPRSCSCPLLYRADCRNRSLKHLTAVIFSESGNKLRSLWLDNNDISSLEINVFEKLTKLRDLSLCHNSLKCLTKNIFGNLKNLVILDLSDNKLQYLDYNLFKSLEKLKKLNLSYNNLKIILGELLSPLQTIEELYLSNNPFDCGDCALRGAVVWTTNKMKDTGATCKTPKPGVRWQDYEFKCIQSIGLSSVDSSLCDAVVENEDSEKKGIELFNTTISLPTILAMIFGIALLIVVFGWMIYCFIHRSSNQNRTENEILEYDDIKSSDYEYYERIRSSHLNNLRYVSATSSITVPDLPQRPKNVSKAYDDICLKDELTRSGSYIDPIVPACERETLRVPPSKETSHDESYIQAGVSKNETNRDEGNSSENALLTPVASISKNYDYITIRENNLCESSKQPKENKNLSAYFWNRESFWKTSI